MFRPSMMSDVLALMGAIIMLFPLSYFLLTSPNFLLVKLDIPEVAQLMRGHFRAYFLMVSIAGVLATVAFAAAGLPAFALGVGAIAAVSVFARRWFVRRLDAQIEARDAGDAHAAVRLRRLHLAGMLSNAVLIVAVGSCIPFLNLT